MGNGMCLALLTDCLESLSLLRGGGGGISTVSGAVRCAPSSEMNVEVSGSLDGLIRRSSRLLRV